MSCEADLAVRAARAEIERDSWRKRAESAEKLNYDLVGRNEKELLDTLHLIGIPARDLKDIFEAWAAGREEYLATHPKEEE